MNHNNYNSNQRSLCTPQRSRKKSLKVSYIIISCVQPASDNLYLISPPSTVWNGCNNSE